MALADGISFTAASAGAGPFVYATARPSFRTPAQAVTDGKLVDGGTYSYLAQNSGSSPTQREWGRTVFTALTNTFTRTPLGGVDLNDVDAGTSPVNFTVPPIVSLTLLAEDVRQVLTADTTYYVATTGSDSNPGTASAPWRTPQHAFDWISANIDAGGFFVTVSIADGTYLGITGFPDDCPPPNCQAFQWIGNHAAPANVVWGTAVNDDGPLDILSSGGSWFFDGITFDISRDNGFNDHLELNGNYNTFTFGNVRFTNSSLASVFSVLSLFGYQNTVVFNGTVGVVGVSATHLFYCDKPASFILFSSGAWTFSGTCAYSGAALLCNGCDVTVHSTTFSGAVTGTRFSAFNGSTIGGLLSGQILGLNFFPGNAPGTVDSASTYDGQFGTGVTYPQQTTAIRTILTADTTFYVATTGSDSNDGSSGSPWATSQHAADFIAENIDAGGHLVTVQFANGTYDGFTLNGGPASCGRYYFFTGNASNPALVTLQSAAAAFGSCVNIVGTVSGLFLIGNMTLAGTGGNTIVGINQDFAQVGIGNDIFDATGSGGAFDAIGIYNTGVNLQLGQIDTIAGNTFKGAFASIIGNWVPSAANIVSSVTLIGTPSFSFATVYSFAAGAYVNAGHETITGSATGRRFWLENGGNIVGDGSGNLNYFPGNSAGAFSFGGGFYDGRQYFDTGGAERIVLGADTTYYVATTGSDSNLGTVGSPWATVQHAFDYLAANIDGAGFFVTIQVANGTYAGPFIIASIPNVAAVFLSGNAGNNTLVVLNDSAGGNAIEFQPPPGFFLVVAGVTLQPLVNGSAAVECDSNGCQIFLGNCSVIAPAGGGGAAFVSFNPLSFIGVGHAPFLGQNGVTCSGNWTNFYLSGTGLCYFESDNSITMSGTPAFSDCFANIIDGGQLLTAFNTYSGAATGKRFNVDAGCIDTGGRGLAFLPGDSAGTIPNGGIYK